MVTRKAAGKKSGSKLKLKKETIHDLDAKGNGAGVKGGTAVVRTGVGPGVGAPTAIRKPILTELCRVP